MTYREAKTTQAALEADVDRLSAALRNFPTGPMGLTPDAVRVTPEYRAAKAAFDAAFERLRRFNSSFTKAFAKELREDRRTRYAARVSA